MLGIARWAAIVWCSLAQIIAVSFVCPNTQCPKQPVNVKLAGTARQGMGWGFDIFFKNLLSNSLPAGKSFQSNTLKFPHPGLHI